MKHEKPELSRKNPYCLPKYRYLELKNFCFQYNDWKRALARLNGWRAQEGDMGGIVKSNVPSDPTAREGMLRAYYTCVYREQPESYVHWYRRVCECLDSTGILHERDKPDPGQWSGTSCLQQRRIISDSQRHLSRQGLWRNLQLFIFFFITHSPKRRCRILQRRKSKWCIWFTCLH